MGRSRLYMVLGLLDGWMDGRVGGGDYRDDEGEADGKAFAYLMIALKNTYWSKRIMVARF